MKIHHPLNPFGILFGIMATSLVSLGLSAAIQQSPQSFDTPEAAMAAVQKAWVALDERQGGPRTA